MLFTLLFFGLAVNGAAVAQPGTLEEHLPAGAVARLGARRFRLEDQAEALNFTPDGKTLVAYTKSGVFVWDAATGHERHRLPVITPYGASAMDISADGAILAAADYRAESDEADVTLWDLGSGKKTATLSLPKGEGPLTRIKQLRFSPDGKSLALASTNKGNVIVFDVASGNRLTSMAGVNSVAYQLAFSPDGGTLALAVGPAAKSAHAVQLWDIATGKLLRTILDLPRMSPNTMVGALAFSPDGKMLAFGILDRVYLHDPATGAKVGRHDATKLRRVTSLTFTPDGKKLTAGSASDGIVQTWDIASGQIVHTFDGGVFPRGRALALAPRAKTVAVSTSHGQIRLWDLATGKDLDVDHQSHDAPIHSLAFSADGKTLASATASGQVFLWDMATKRRSAILPGDAHSLMFSPVGARLAMVGGDKSHSNNRARIWDLAAGQELLTIIVPGKNDIQTATFALDGRTLFTLAGRLIHQWDVATGKQDKQWTIPPSPTNNMKINIQRGLPSSPFYALASDGKSAFDVSDNRDIRIYVAQAPRARLLSGLSDDRMLSFSASPDARILATGVWGPNAGVRLWEVVTGKQIRNIHGHQGGVVALAWSADGRVVASGEQRSDLLMPSLSQTVRLWDSATGKELARFAGFDADVAALAFSSDGAFLAVGLRDSTILIWDLTNAYPKSRPAPSLTMEELTSRWSDLAQDDAGKAHASIGALVVGAQESVPFLKSHLKPVDGAKIKQWIADLNSANYNARQAAGKELAKSGEEAKGPMQAALTGDLPLETHRRLVLLLASLPEVPSRPGTVRTIRAIIVLERIGSPSAQAVLRHLATGAPGARATEEAKASLQRLANRK